MIKTFCDCCGVEIKSASKYIGNSLCLPESKTMIEPHSNICNVVEEFSIELSISAKIYIPKNVNDRQSGFVGTAICEDCIIETLVQRKRK